MKKSHTASMMTTLAAGFLIIGAGCVFPTTKESDADGTAPARNRLAVSWQFASEMINDEPYTLAWLVISGKMIQKESAGKFYGGVMKSYLATDGPGDIIEEGSLGGFMTYYSGTGVEVVARYDEMRHSITLLNRYVGEDAGEVPYSAIRTFTIRERGIIDSPPRGD